MELGGWLQQGCQRRCSIGARTTSGSVVLGAMVQSARVIEETSQTFEKVPIDAVVAGFAADAVTSAQLAHRGQLGA